MGNQAWIEDEEFTVNLEKVLHFDLLLFSLFVVQLVFDIGQRNLY